MRIAVISDLHLGRGDAADRFGHDDAEFLRFLDRLESEHERVVLLGDVWETLTSPRPFAAADELQAARGAHPELARRFREPRYTYIHGNHDLVAGRIDEAPDEVMLRVDGTRFLFTHGHVHDRLIRHARILAEGGTWLVGWLLRLGQKGAARLMDRLDNVFAGVSPDPKRCTFQRWAVATAVDRGADVVVTGHTHLGLRAEHGDRLFLNSGSCAEGRFSFLSLDTRRGDYGVHTAL